MRKQCVPGAPPFFREYRGRGYQSRWRYTPSGKHLREAIATDLLHRYASLNHQKMLRVPAFLDPRFEDLDSFIPESDRKDVKEAVKLQMLELTVADERTDETRLSLRQRQMHIHLSLSKIPHLLRKLNLARSPTSFQRSVGSVQ